MIYTALISTFLSFFYVGPNGDYAVLLPTGTSLMQVDTLTNGELNSVFLAHHEQAQFDYSLSFVVVSTEGQELLSEETVRQYERECQCLVRSTASVSFLHFSGVRYQISKVVENTSLDGYVYISNIEKGKSINVVGITIEGKADSMKSELDLVLDNLILNF